jgi:hypothetical protein
MTGAIIINLTESPSYVIPNTQTDNEKRIGQWDFLRIFENSPLHGPIIENGRRWIGAVGCTIHVQLRGEDCVIAVGTFLLY